MNFSTGQMVDTSSREVHINKPCSAIALTFCFLALGACATTNPEEGTAAGATSDPVDEVVTPVTASKADKLECRRERVTGTHMVQEVCLTRSQREAMEEEGKKTMRKAQRGVGRCATPGCD